jgi:hypothetical protein
MLSEPLALGDRLSGRVRSLGVDEPLRLGPDCLTRSAHTLDVRVSCVPQSTPTFIFTHGMPWATQPPSCSASSASV